MVFWKKANWVKFKKPAIITLSSIFGILAALYAVFLIAPFFVDLNKFTPNVQSELKKYTKLDFELQNPKLSTTFDLALKLSADKIALKYKNGAHFALLENASIKINLPTLLVKHLNLDKIYVKKADVSLVFDKNKKYTIMDYFIEQPKAQNEAQEAQLPVEIRNIKLVVDELNFKLKDENTSKTFLLNAKGNLIHLASLNGPLKVKTKGFLGLEGRKAKFIDFDVNLQTKLPEIAQKPQKKEETEFKMIDFNPFENFEKFNFYANILADLKINDVTSDFKADGTVKISDITLALNSVQLPKSFAQVEFKGNDIIKKAKLYVAQNEFIALDSKIKTGKNLKLDLNAKTDRISLNNIRQLSAAVFDMFNIENDLKNAQTTGYLTCDFNLKSDGKKIQSQGKSELKEGSFKYPKMALNVTNIVSLLDFSNNKLTIKDTSAFLNGSKFSVKGEILTNSQLNINVNSDPIKIMDIVRLGTQLKVIRASDVKDYDFRGGIIKIAVKLTGKLDKITPDASIDVQNVAMIIKSLAMPVNIENIKIKAVPNKKDFIANIDVTNVTGHMTMPKFNLKIPKMNMKADSKIVNIPQTDIYLDDTKAALDGKIEEYMINPNFNFDAKGNIAPSSVVQLVDKPNQKYIRYAGKMPAVVNVNGDFNNIKVTGKITSNPQNYVSVVDINTINGLENILNFDINLAGDNLSLNDISLLSKGSKIAEVKGKIGSIYKKNPTIAALNISLPQKLTMTVGALGNLKLAASGNIAVSGSAASPVLSGSASVADLYYPQFGLKIGDLKLDFKRSVIDASASGISVAKSDFSGDAQISSDFSKAIRINSLNFNSNHFDSDELLKLMSSMPNTPTTPGPSAPAGFEILKGRGTIGNIKSGTLSAQNVGFDFDLKNNLFNIKNMQAAAYDGKISGDIDYHLAQLRTNVNVSAKDINVAKFGKAMGSVVVPITGTADGIAKVSFKGATFDQQMKSLNGSAKFNVQEGHMEDFIKFENFLYASNLISQNLFKFNLNSIISSVSSKNTSYFKKLEGVINFADGWANLQTFKSQGPSMSLNVDGKYNLTTNFADLTVLGRVSSAVASVMGPLGDYSVSNLIDKAASANETVSTILNIAKAVAPANPLLQTVTPSEIAKIPALSTGETANTKSFRVVINGLATKTTSVKSFKWVEVPQASTN